MRNQTCTYFFQIKNKKKKRKQKKTTTKTTVFMFFVDFLKSGNNFGLPN